METASVIQTRLLALVSDEELSGLDLQQAYLERQEEKIALGTLYWTMRKMGERGWIKVRDDDSSDGRFRYFAITDKGREILANSREYYRATANFGLQSPAKG